MFVVLPTLLIRIHRFVIVVVVLLVIRILVFVLVVVLHTLCIHIGTDTTTVRRASVTVIVAQTQFLAAVTQRTVAVVATRIKQTNQSEIKTSKNDITNHTIRETNSVKITQLESIHVFDTQRIN
jgi:hypothetical protein